MTAAPDLIAPWLVILAPLLLGIMATVVAPSPWLTGAEAAERARVGRKCIYREIRAGRLRAAIVGGRRDYRLLASWVDSWLEASSTPVEVRPLREVRR